MNTKLISCLGIFVSFPPIIHFSSIASLASGIEIFRDRISNRILALFNIILYVYVHFTISCSLFFIILVVLKSYEKEFFRIYYVFTSWNRIIQVSHIFPNEYIIYRVQRMFSRVCLLFTFFGLSFIFCSRLETFLTIFHFQEIGFVFKHVSTCRAYPLSIFFFDAQSRIAQLFVDSSWQLDVWNFVRRVLLLI